MQKIVRLELIIDGVGNYFFDQQYDESKTNQQNCDDTFKIIVDAVQGNKTLAVGLNVTGVSSGERIVPTIINSANIKVLSIDSAKVYDIKEPAVGTAE